MNLRLNLAVCVLILSTHTHAGEKAQQGRYLATPLKGDYYVYGGTMSEELPPTAKDMKVSLMLVGQLARNLFNTIGPDAKVSCSDAAGYRERRRGDLSCTYTKDDGYACYFGIDVPTGKSTYGSIC